MVYWLVLESCCWPIDGSHCSSWTTRPTTSLHLLAQPINTILGEKVPIGIASKSSASNRSSRVGFFNHVVCPDLYWMSYPPEHVNGSPRLSVTNLCGQQPRVIYYYWLGGFLSVPPALGTPYLWASQTIYFTARTYLVLYINFVTGPGMCLRSRYRCSVIAPKRGMEACFSDNMIRPREWEIALKSTRW